MAVLSAQSGFLPLAHARWVSHTEFVSVSAETVLIDAVASFDPGGSQRSQSSATGVDVSICFRDRVFGQDSTHDGTCSSDDGQPVVRQ